MREDPNSWTKSYVSSNRSACLAHLREVNLAIIQYVRQGNYKAAITGLDRILNGLVVMSNSGCGNFSSHMSMFSLAEGIILIANPFKDAKEGNVRETAIKALMDARDFAQGESTKQIVENMINAFQAGKSIEQIDPEFPDSVVEVLQSMDGQLAAAASSGSAGVSSGGCYIATAVYGSYDCPEVWTLRRFRDLSLAKTRCGRILIRMYYTISPTLVKWCGHTKWFRKMWKNPLDKLVRKLRSKGYASTLYQDNGSL